MSKNDPFNVFDWYFTDVSERDGARFHALKAQKAETSVLMDLIRADSLVHYALWSELPANHPVGELWLETQTDLLASVYLAYGGFFRQALCVLRCWFEIAVHGVYFSGHYGQKNEKYEQWRRGDRRAPAKMEQVAKSLASRNDMVKKADEATILRKLKPIYSFLSQQIHAQGLDIHKLQNGRDNVPRFLSRSYDIWYKETLEAFDAVCFLYGIFFPNVIASYLKGSKGELNRTCELMKSLSKALPDFRDLLNDVFATIKTSRVDMRKKD